MNVYPSYLADLLVPRGPEFSLNPREPLAALRTLVMLGSIACLLLVLVRLCKARGILHLMLGGSVSGFTRSSGAGWRRPRLAAGK